MLSQALQLFNFWQSFENKYTLIGTTTVPATVSSTVISTSQVVLTQTSTVPTTVATTVTSTSTITRTYACPTTLLTTSVTATTATPTITTTSVVGASTTVVLVANPTIYKISAVGGYPPGPSYVAQSIYANYFAQLTPNIQSAQEFVIAQISASDTYYNLIGVGSGAFQGVAFGIATDGHIDNDVTGNLVGVTPKPQTAPPSQYGQTEAAIWAINDFSSLQLALVFTNPPNSSPASTSLDVVVNSNDGTVQATDDVEAVVDEAYQVVFSLVPAPSN